MVENLRFRDQILYYCAKHELSRNTKFKNLHKGQSCYVFGNGVSLKSMDLTKFNDKVSIGCNSLFVHKDFSSLDCRYYQIPPSLLFYKYRKYYGKRTRNYIGDLYRKKILEHPKTNFFTSFSNILSMRANNVFYEHHFGCKKPNLNQCDLAGVFSYLVGGLHAMLGTAMYLGFDSAILVGCDYTFSPKLNLHFFEKGLGVGDSSDMLSCLDPIFENFHENMKLTTITLDGMKSDLNFQTYSEYLGVAEDFKENTQIVDEYSLDLLHKQGYYSIY